jgi:hypothetical protein
VTVPVLDPVHHERHRLTPHHAARESLAYLLQLPEEGLGGYFYTWVNAESLAGAVLCLYGPGVGDAPVYESVDGVPIPPDQPFTDWRVGPLTLAHGERAHGRFAGDAASIEFSFEPIHPPYNYASHPDGPLPWMANDRYEQSGRWQGALRLHAREISFDVISHRDHSWGIRDWGACQHYRWLEANAGPDVSLQFTQDCVLGHSNVRGYVYRDGAMAQITAVDCDYELDAEMIHTSFEAVVADDAGRTTSVSGRTYAHMDFPAPPITTVVVCSTTLQIEGRPGRGQLDLLWTNDYLAHVREHGLPALPPRRPPR